MASHGASSVGGSENAQNRVQDLQVDDKHCYQYCNASDSDFGSTEDEPFPFTDLPYDIRARIYEVFFGMSTYKLPQPEPRRPATPYVGLNQTHPTTAAYFVKIVKGRAEVSKRLTAHEKVSFLLANKSIYTEASPFFYRLHWFRMLLWYNDGDPGGRLPWVVPEDVLHVFQKWACVSLFYKDPYRELGLGKDVASYLAFLDQNRTHLKRLSIEVKVADRNKILPGDRLVTALTHVWPRLDFLQVCWFDQRPQGSFRFEDRIAPGMQWTHGEADQGPPAASYAVPRRPRVRRNVFWVERRHDERE